MSHGRDKKTPEQEKGNETKSTAQNALLLAATVSTGVIIAAMQARHARSQVLLNSEALPQVANERQESEFNHPDNTILSEMEEDAAFFLPSQENELPPRNFGDQENDSDEVIYGTPSVNRGGSSVAANNQASTETKVDTFHGGNESAHSLKETYLPATHQFSHQGLSGSMHSMEQIEDNNILGLTNNQVVLLNWDQDTQQLQTKILLDIKSSQLRPKLNLSDSQEPRLTNLIFDKKTKQFILMGIYRQNHRWRTFMAFCVLSNAHTNASIKSMNFFDEAITFTTPIVDENKILLGSKSGKIYVIDLDNKKINVRCVHQAHEGSVVSIKYMGATYNNDIEYLSSSARTKEVKKWKYRFSDKEATLAEHQWTYTVPTNLVSPYDHDLCILRDFVAIATPKMNGYKKTEFIDLVDRETGKLVRRYNDTPADALVTFKFDHSMALLYSNGKLSLVKFEANGVHTLDSLEAPNVGNGMRYASSVTNLVCLSPQVFLLSNGCDIVKYDFNKRDIEYFTNLSFPSEHFNAESWVFLNETMLLIQENDESNPTAVIKIYAENKLEKNAQFAIFLNGSLKGTSAPISHAFFSHPYFERGILKDIKEYAESVTGSNRPGSNSLMY